MQLRGGILRYLEERENPAASKFEGECYVFDKRVAVGHGLTAGTATQCFACRAVLMPEDTQHPNFETGVRCGHCPEKIRGKVDEAAAARARVDFILPITITLTLTRTLILTLNPTRTLTRTLTQFRRRGTCKFDLRKREGSGTWVDNLGRRRLS